MEKTNIAVSVIIIKDGKILLLKRTNPPYKWGPPAGRVYVGEGLNDAALRETKEESNINVKLILPVAVWSGLHEGEQLTSITFLADYISGDVAVSDEHSEFAWVNLEELLKYDITHSHKEFKIAFELFNFYKENNNLLK